MKKLYKIRGRGEGNPIWYENLTWDEACDKMDEITEEEGWDADDICFVCDC